MYIGSIDEKYIYTSVFVFDETLTYIVGKPINGHIYGKEITNSHLSDLQNRAVLPLVSSSLVMAAILKIKENILEKLDHLERCFSV